MLLQSNKINQYDKEIEDIYGSLGEIGDNINNTKETVDSLIKVAEIHSNIFGEVFGEAKENQEK